MHPYLTEVMAKAHKEGLHREASRHRLAALPRGVQPGLTCPRSRPEPRGGVRPAVVLTGVKRPSPASEPGC